jgi:hypothetical protein
MHVRGFGNSIFVSLPCVPSEFKHRASVPMESGHTYRLVIGSGETKTLMPATLSYNKARNCQLLPNHNATVSQKPFTVFCNVKASLYFLFLLHKRSQSISTVTSVIDPIPNTIRRCARNTRSQMVGVYQ